MSRKLLIWLLVVVVVLALLGGAGLGGLYLYKAQRAQGWRDNALRAYGEGNWLEARKYFEFYLIQDPENAELLMKYAQANLNILTNRHEALSKAGTAYRQVLRYDPGNEEARTKLIDMYVRAGSWMQLEYVVDQWLRASPDDEEFLRLRATALENLGRRDEAIEAYEEVLEKAPDDPEIYGSLARLLREQGNTVHAEQLLDEALEKCPDDGRINFARAEYFAAARDLGKVEAEMREALEKAPDNTDVLLAACRLANARREMERALDYVNRAMEIEPDNPKVRHALARTRLNMDQPSRAVAAFDGLSLESMVDQPEMLLTIADIQTMAKHREEAHETLDFYLAAYPAQRPVADYFKARELIQDGKPEEAATILSPFLKRRPGFTLARLALAEAYLASGDRDLAERALSDYLSENPGDPRAQTIMARQFGSLKGVEDVADQAKDILEDEESSAALLRSAGLALLDASQYAAAGKGHIRMAANLLEKAVARDPEMVDAYRGLVEAYLAAGGVDKAESVLTRASEAGIPSEKMAMAGAAVDLANGDTDSAEELYAQAPDKTDEAVIAWIRFFAEHGAADLAKKILQERLDATSGEEQTPYLIEQALLAERSGDMDELLGRIRELDASISSDAPEREDFNALRARTAHRLLTDNTEESSERARELLEAMAGEDFTGPDVLTTEALLLLQSDSPDLVRARGLFDQALRAEPGNLSALLGMSFCLTQLGDLQNAIGYAEQASALAPNSLPAQLQLADLQVKLRRHIEAERLLATILTRYPNHPIALELEVANYLTSGKTAEAEKALNRLVEEVRVSEERRSSVARLRGQLLLRQGRFAEAEKALRAILNTSGAPDDFGTLRALAASIAAQGRKAEAKQMLSEYVAERGGLAQDYVALAEFYMGLGGDSLREASTALTRAMIAEPDNPAALRAMIRLQVLQGSAPNALNLCERYLEQYPNDPGVLFEKASLLLQLGRAQDGALDCINRSLDIDDSPESIGLRGLIRLALKDYDGALRDFRAVSQALGEVSGAVELGMAEAYLATGERDLAQSYLASVREKADRGEPVDTGRLARLEEAIRGEGGTQ